MTIPTGSRLGPYEVLGQIGAGGMGEVYRAKDPRLGREVAIKVLPSHLTDDPDLKAPEFYGLFIKDRLAVLYTPYDFASGLNRESNSYAKGVESKDALRLVLNLITYSLSN